MMQKHQIERTQAGYNSFEVWHRGKKVFKGNKIATALYMDTLVAKLEKEA
jgi:hypothetical protein